MRGRLLPVVCLGKVGQNQQCPVNLPGCQGNGSCLLVKLNKRIDNPFVGPSNTTFVQIKRGKLRNTITHNVIWANRKNIECIPGLTFDITCFPVFVGASNVI